MRTDRTAVVRYGSGVSAVLVIALIGGAWIAPIRKRGNDLRRRLGELNQSFEAARKTMQRVTEMEQATAQARGEMNRLHGDPGKGSALVWLPKMVKEHFKQVGIAVTTIRLNAVQEEPGLPGYTRAYWGISLPLEDGGKSVTAVLLAVTEMEEQNRHLKVLDFAIQPDVDNPLLRTAAFNIKALIRK